MSRKKSIEKFGMLLSLCLGMLLCGCGDDDGGANNQNLNQNANDNNNNGGAECGNGILESGEACDDGGANSDTVPNACRTSCVLASCGDGVPDTGEACDDGGTNSDTVPNACRTSCALASCGDGVPDTGEACDDGASNSDSAADACRTSCELAGCGDGVVDTGEVCDAGASNSDSVANACRTSCELAGCGDGVVDTGEACDAGASNSDSVPDACRTSCELASCGDGVVDTGEACDDGASNSDTLPNACRTSCELPSCGDGVMDDAAPSNESCDEQDFGGATCLGLVGVDGTLTCRADCSLDLIGCGALEWIAIPGGSYDMGDTILDPTTQPVHSVTLSGYELTRTEVTVRQYGNCVTAGACTAPGTGGLCNGGVSGYEEHPVNCVEWNQAIEFCAWAGGRLPSESEWEHAARSGGQAIDYPWGNATVTCSYAVMYEADSGCGTGHTFAVCAKTAGNTSQGLCDMAGNLYEWVEDDWHLSYTGAPTDGSAWVDNPRGSLRVVRGGGFTSTDPFLRTAGRDLFAPSAQWAVGIRCARDAP